MIDVSDGISSDLLHLCKSSGVGCHLYEANLPIAQPTFDLALKFQIDPTVCALNGGEDYELLFTIDPKDDRKLADDFDISVIGKITGKKEGYKLETNSHQILDLTAQGWRAV